MHAVVIHQPLLAVLSVGCVAAAVVWGRSTQRLKRAWRRVLVLAAEAGAADAPEIAESERVSAELARSAYRKELHTTLLYGAIAVCAMAAAFTPIKLWQLPYLLVLIPIGVTLRYGPRFLSEASLTEERALRIRKAERALEQELEAPRRWATRLAPDDLPHIEGFEVGQTYESGEGLMAGDFYDLHAVSDGRLAAVIGDVAGHGIEPSITAFQVKYLLRVFLRQYRDPAQALEELNKVLSTSGRPEDMVSVCVVVFDTEAGTLRHASAGHPAAWL